MTMSPMELAELGERRDAVRPTLATKTMKALRFEQYGPPPCSRFESSQYLSYVRVRR